MDKRNSKEEEVWVKLRQGGETYSRYEVSNYSRVWDLQNNIEVSQVVTGKPQYLYVNLYRDDNSRTLRRVHNIVGWSFLGDPPTKNHTVDHKDRDKFNNHLDNLRWATREEQSANRGITKCLDGVPITKILRDNGYDTSRDIGKYLYRRMVVFNDTFTEAIFSWAESIRPPRRIKPLKYSCSLEYDGMWFPNSESFQEHYSISKSSYDRLRSEGKSLKEIIEFDSDDYRRVWVDGLFMTRQEHCDRLCISYGRVRGKMNKHKLTFEEATLLPIDRIIKHSLNGVVKKNYEWYGHFGVPRGTAKNRLSRNKGDFRKTLEHFGVDTSGMEIYPCDGDVIMKNKPM